MIHIFPNKNTPVLSDSEVTILFSILMIIIGIGLGTYLYYVGGFWYPMIVVTLYGLGQLIYEYKNR